MTIDFTKTGQLLDDFLFVQTNATAHVQSTDLVSFAEILDQNLPLGTTDPTPFIAAIKAGLTGELASLSSDQIAAAASWFLPYREPPPAPAPTEGPAP